MLFTPVVGAVVFAVSGGVVAEHLLGMRTDLGTDAGPNVGGDFLPIFIEKFNR